MKKGMLAALMATLIATIASHASSEAGRDFLPARVISPAAPLFVPGTYRITGHCHQELCNTTFEIILHDGQLGVRVDQAPVEAVVDGESITLPSQGIRFEVFRVPFGLGEAIVIYAERDFPRGFDSRGQDISKDAPMGQLGLVK